MSDSDLLALLQKLLVALAAGAGGQQGSPTTGGTGLTPGSGAAGSATQIPAPPVLSSIDKMIGGEALVGYKMMFGVIGYVIVAILKAAGVLGAATPAGQILSVLTLAFTALGGLSKIDRMTQSLATIAADSIEFHKGPLLVRVPTDGRLLTLRLPQ